MIPSVNLHKATPTLNVDKSIQPQDSHSLAKELTAARQSDTTLEVPGNKTLEVPGTAEIKVSKTVEKFNKTLEMPETKRLMNTFIDAAFSQLNLKF